MSQTVDTVVVRSIQSNTLVLLKTSLERHRITGIFQEIHSKMALAEPEPTNFSLLDCDPPVGVRLSPVEHVFDHFITVIDISMAFWIILSNCFVLVVYFTSKRERRPVDLHIMSLTFSDVLQGLVTTPMDEVLPFLKIKDKACFIVFFLTCAFTFVQGYILLAGAVDRYWAVIYPMHYQTKATKKITMCNVYYARNLLLLKASK